MIFTSSISFLNFILVLLPFLSTLFPLFSARWRLGLDSSVSKFLFRIPAGHDEFLLWKLSFPSSAILLSLGTTAFWEYFDMWRSEAFVEGGWLLVKLEFCSSLLTLMGFFWGRLSSILLKSRRKLLLEIVLWGLPKSWFACWEVVLIMSLPRSVWDLLITINWLSEGAKYKEIFLSLKPF